MSPGTFRHARKWQLATVLPTSCRLPSFPRMDVSSSGPHSFKLLGPLLLMTIPSYGSACTLLHSAGLLHAATSRTSSCSWPRRAIAGQTNRRRPASWPAHRRLRPAGGRPPPALIVVRPCPWPMGHDGLSPSCRAKSIVAVMTLWQPVILSPKQCIRACLRETVQSPTSCRLWAVWAGPDVPTTLGLHPPATKPIQGGNFWIGRRKGAGVGGPVNRTRGTIYKAFGSNGDLRPGLMASPVQSSVQCLKHKVQRRRPARTWYNPHELRELWSRGPHPICMHVYYVAIPLHDRGTSGSGPRTSWPATTKTYASASRGVPRRTAGPP